MPGARGRTAVAILLTLLASAGYAFAPAFARGFGGAGQRDFGFGESVRFAPALMPDGNFTVCRIMYTSVRREPNGGGWRTDFPYGEINLMIRLSELTKTPVSFTSAHRPNAWVVRLTDEQLFNCPYTVASDVGTIGLSDAEAERLRLYLLKGGFLWVDDFWGSYAWNHWASQIRKVFAPPDYPIVDLPPDHPLYHTQFNIARTAQITNIGFWLSTGQTSERGADSAQVHTRAILDKDGRVMILMTHNTDFGDSWEREAEDPSFFQKFAADGYAFGINVVLYAMTH